jgi:NADH-quinone oxidoreductase subunit C
MSTSSPTTEPTDDPVVPPGLARALEALSQLAGAPVRTEAFRDNLRAFVPASVLLVSLRTLRDDCGFHFLAELGATDYLGYPGRAADRSRFEVHYCLTNLDSGDRLVVKVGVDDPDPALPSATAVWAGADWMEREVFDMYGIRFEGHPDLRRILMPEPFVAFPLRKDYPLRGRGERHNFPRITREQS